MQVRISVTYFDGDGNVYFVSSLLAASNARADVDAAVASGWADSAMAVAIVNSATNYPYSRKP